MANFTKRSLLRTTLLTFCTFGLYDLYYLIVTRRELNRAGGDVPSAWLLLVPIVNIYFIYRYAQNYAVIVKKDRGVIESLIYFLLILSPAIKFFGNFKIITQIERSLSHDIIFKVMQYFNIVVTAKIFMWAYLITAVLVMSLVIAAKIAILQDGFNDYKH